MKFLLKRAGPTIFSRSQPEKVYLQKVYTVLIDLSPARSVGNNDKEDQLDEGN